jgi:predicted nucleotidyltransferase
MRRFIFTEDEKQSLEHLGVEAVILFGSRALGLSRRSSDYDYGVLVKDKGILKSFEKRKEIYDKLYNLLSEKINELVDIDIVFLEDAPAELQLYTAKYGTPIYEENPNAFNNFKEYVMLLYSDFEPYLKLCNL